MHTHHELSHRFQLIWPLAKQSVWWHIFNPQHILQQKLLLQLRSSWLQYLLVITSVIRSIKHAIWRFVGRKDETYIEVHVRSVLLYPLLVHHKESNTVEQIKCPFILWDKTGSNENLLKIIWTNERYKRYMYIALVLPESIWTKTALTNVLGLAAIDFTAIN